MKKKAMAILMAILLIVTAMPTLTFAGDEGQSVKVKVIAQAGGSYLMPPQMEETVSSNAAENLGYSDECEGQVSALDALVVLHEKMFGEAFLSQPTKFLEVSTSGFVTTIFGEATYGNGFLLNGGTPNDGTESEWGGYNGTTVCTTPVVDGDELLFYIYQDAYYGDLYSYVTVEEVTAGEEFTATVIGTMVMMGYLYPTAASMKNAALAVEDACLALIDLGSGELTPFDAVTDEKGVAVLTAPETPGTYYITAINNEDEEVYLLMNPVKLYVKEKTPAPVEPVVADPVTVTLEGQAAGAFVYLGKAEVPADAAEKLGYMDGCSSETSVSALDAMVVLHQAVFGADFAESPSSYLAVSEYGYVTTIFGEATGNNGFMINGGYPNDGTESEWGGYNGTTVNTTPIVNGDDVLFYIYQDSSYWSDVYTWVELTETNDSGKAMAYAKGSMVMGGYAYATPEEFEASAKADYVEGAGLAWLDLSTGEIEVIEDTYIEEGAAKIDVAEGESRILVLQTNEDEMVYVIMNLKNAPSTKDKPEEEEPEGSEPDDTGLTPEEKTEKLAEIEATMKQILDEIVADKGAELACLDPFFVFTCARAGYYPAGTSADRMYEVLLDVWKEYKESREASGKKVVTTEAAKFVLAVTALGHDARHFGEENLIDTLIQADDNGAYYADHYRAYAIYSGRYDDYQSYGMKALERELNTPGGHGTSVDDMDVMNAQILFLYMTSASDELANKVTEYIHTQILPWISQNQTAEGNYLSQYSENGAGNVWTNAQVQMLLNLLNEDPIGNDYVKRGHTSADLILAHPEAGKSLASDPSQTARGLVSILRYAKGQTNLFDCSDVLVIEDPKDESSEEESKEESSEEESKEESSDEESKDESSEEESKEESSEEESKDESSEEESKQESSDEKSKEESSKETSKAESSKAESSEVSKGTPATGDNFHAGLYLIMMLSAAGMIAGLFFYKKRRENEV